MGYTEHYVLLGPDYTMKKEKITQVAYHFYESYASRSHIRIEEQPPQKSVVPSLGWVNFVVLVQWKHFGPVNWSLAGQLGIAAHTAINTPWQKTKTHCAV